MVPSTPPRTPTTAFRDRRSMAVTCVVTAVIALVACGNADPLAEVACDSLVFSSLRSGEWQIHILSDGEVTRLATDGPALNPTWSPDGSRILFTSVREGDHDLSTMAPDGPDIGVLTDDDAFDSSGDWSPDGGRIVFDRVIDDDAYRTDVDETDVAQIFVKDLREGSVARQLTTGEPNAKPRWSPDGTTIAFLSWRDGDAEIYAMASDGTGQRDLSNSPGRDLLPAWSPDGSELAFVSDRDGDLEIYVMHADGGDQRRLTHHPADDTDPAWSADGRHILFTSEREAPGIYVTAADGGSPPVRVTDGSVSDCQPAGDAVHPSRFRWPPCARLGRAAMSPAGSTPCRPRRTHRQAPTSPGSVG